MPEMPELEVDTDLFFDAQEELGDAPSTPPAAFDQIYVAPQTSICLPSTPGEDAPASCAEPNPPQEDAAMPAASPASPNVVDTEADLVEEVADKVGGQLAMVAQPPVVEKTAASSTTALGLQPNEAAALAALREAVVAESNDPEFSWWLTDACLCRYLRARGWNVQKVGLEPLRGADGDGHLQATKMLKGSLDWRAKFRPQDITWEEVAKEAETGKMYVSDKRDAMNRPILYMKPGKENTKDHTGQIKYLVYTLETALKHTLQAEEAEPVARGAGVNLAPEQICLVIDYAGWGLRNAPPMKTSKETLSILQNQYPERLGKAVLVNPPMVFSGFWKVISPFIDPRTKTKLTFTPKQPVKAQQELAKTFGDLKGLEMCVGGLYDFNFSHAVCALRHPATLLHQ